MKRIILLVITVFALVTSYGQYYDNLFVPASANINCGITFCGTEYENERLSGIGMNVSVFGIYLSYSKKEAEHTHSVQIDKWKEIEMNTVNLGYAIPITKWLMVIPNVGSCTVSEVIVDGREWEFIGYDLFNAKHVAKESYHDDFGLIWRINLMKENFGFYADIRTNKHTQGIDFGLVANWN